MNFKNMWNILGLTVVGSLVSTLVTRCMILNVRIVSKEIKRNLKKEDKEK